MPLDPSDPRDRAAMAAFGQPLRPLPISGHQCSVSGCVGYVRRGRLCADHIPKVVG